MRFTVAPSDMYKYKHRYLRAVDKSIQMTYVTFLYNIPVLVHSYEIIIWLCEESTTLQVMEEEDDTMIRTLQIDQCFICITIYEGHDEHR